MDRDDRYIERDRCRKCYSKCGKMNIWLILVMIWNSLYYSYKVSVKCEIILKQKVKRKTKQNMTSEKEDTKKIYAGWKYKVVQPLHKVIWHFPKNLNMYLPCDPATELSCIYSRERKLLFIKSLYTDVHRSFVYNSPKLESTKTPFNR